MAAFGENSHGSPLGALRPRDVFDASGMGYYSYSGFSNRSGLMGFSGFSTVSGYSSFCGREGLEFIPWKPTLTFPLDYTVMVGPMEVTWREAIPPDPCDNEVTYEIQLTRTFSEDSGWQTIAMDVPQGTSLLVDFGVIPASDDCAIRIRGRDRNNLFSTWSTSNIAFSIANHPPEPVDIVYPLGNETIDNGLLVIWSEATARDIDGHAVTYRIEVTPLFSSDQAWVVVPNADALPEGTTSFSVNTFDFPDGDDYGLRIIPTDEMGADGLPAAVGHIKVKHNGNFFVDTLPPEGTMMINDGQDLANDRRVKLNLFAIDVASGVKEVRFRNLDEDCWSEWTTYSEEKFWNLSSGDGVKRVLVQYRDWAGNTSEACDCEIISRVLCDDGNATGVDSLNGKLYASFDRHGNLVEYRVMSRTAINFDQPQLTALARVGRFLYVAAHDPVANNTFVYTFDGAIRQSVVVPGKVLTMVGFLDKLYAGTLAGRIYQISGSAVAVVYNPSIPYPIQRLRSDGIDIFAAVQGGSSYLISDDGITWRVMSL